MDWGFDPQVSEIAKLAAPGAGGAFIYHAAKPAKTLAKMMTNFVAGVICAVIFTPPFIEWRGIDTDYEHGVAAIFGIVGLGMASGLIKAVEQINFAALLPEKVRKDEK